MFQDTSTRSNGISCFREAVSWRNERTKERKIDNVMSPGQAQMKSPKGLPSSAFKVYDRILEKNRYIPRKWTQEEFEAAFPERFKNNTNETRPDFRDVEKDEFDDDKEKEQAFIPSENAQQPSCSNLQNGFKTKEKIKNLKAIFEKAGNTECHASRIMDKLESLQTGCKVETELDGAETEELERCKDSEARVKLLEEDTRVSPLETAEVLNEVFEKQTEIGQNEFPSFIKACLQCLLSINPFVNILSNISAAPENNLSPILNKLFNFLHSTPSIENEEQYSELHQLFQDFYLMFSESKKCDEVLAIILEILIQEMREVTRDEEKLRSLIQGMLCHTKTCESCKTITKDSEAFLFLNPTTPLSTAADTTSVLDVNFLSCDAEGVWYISSRQFVISAETTVRDLKEKLVKTPEFYASRCEPSSTRIGEVQGGKILVIFDDEDEVSTIMKRSPTSSVFAFNVLNFHSEVAEEFNSLSNIALPYHLYFNCGLCLSDGKEVGLFVHKNCGGMVCRECLDVITQSYQDWELCPCPICERPIDLDKELCKARTSHGTASELHSTRSMVEVLFRADTPIDGGMEWFGYPLLVSLPRPVTGHHLYRSIGYLLPNALPMKDRTSFTLHTVNKSGQCSTCSLDSCNGCLVRIDDSVRITRDTSLVVHFDDLAEESKKNFGVPNLRVPQQSQGLFDGILQSCVQASTSERMLCSKCSNPCKVSSSITQFPQVLVIYLNQVYADTGLSPNTTIADVSRFLVLQHGDYPTGEKGKEDLTYQLAAVALADESAESPTHKAFVPGSGNDSWTSYEESDINPYQQRVAKNSVLFYQAVRIQSSGPPKHGHVLQMPLLQDNRWADACPIDDSRNAAYNLHGPKLATISEESATRSPRKSTKNFTRATRTQASPKRRSKAYDRQLEPGECYPGIGLANNRGLLKADVYSSQLSLGEISRDAMAARMTVDLDGISPISAQDIWKSDSKMIRETKKLIRAVQREDAYGIVRSLKRGANPCLVINDVSALHFAAGIQSEQRCSMVAYLLKYSHDVNVPTADGTTPVHVAAAWGHLDALELLLAHGGDAFDITDQEGNNAFDLASKDCSTFLQLLCQSDANSPASLQPSTSSRTSLGAPKTKRLEDIVRSNVTLPSFVHDEDTSRSRLRHRVLKRFRSFRNKSSGVWKSLRRMSSIRRRSRIGVMVAGTEEESTGDNM